MYESIKNPTQEEIKRITAAKVKDIQSKHISKFSDTSDTEPNSQQNHKIISLDPK